MYDAEAVFICGERDRLTVGSDIEAFHVPMNLAGEESELLGREVQVGETLELGVLVRGEINSFPVFAELCAGVGDFFRAPFGSEQSFLTRGRVHQPEIRFVRGNFFQDQNLFAIWRPVQRGPAPADHRCEDAIALGNRRTGWTTLSDVQILSACAGLP